MTIYLCVYLFAYLSPSFIRFIYLFVYVYTPCGGRLEYLHHSPPESYKATKRDSDIWGYNWTTLLVGDINTETWTSRLGVEHKTDNLALEKT
jgi:hypothetical protein